MNLIKKLSTRSPWLFRINAGSCNGCDVELATTACISRYDVERLGCKYCGSPRHADIVLITGPLTARVKDKVLRVWNEIPEPKVTVAVGICPISGGVFREGYSIEGPVDRYLPIDVNVPGCPPRPQAIMEGVLEAVAIWRKGWRADMEFLKILWDNLKKGPVTDAFPFGENVYPGPPARAGRNRPGAVRGLRHVRPRLRRRSPSTSRNSRTAAASRSRCGATPAACAPSAATTARPRPSPSPTTGTAPTGPRKNIPRSPAPRSNTTTVPYAGPKCAFCRRKCSTASTPSIRSRRGRDLAPLPELPPHRRGGRGRPRLSYRPARKDGSPRGSLSRSAEKGRKGLGGQGKRKGSSRSGGPLPRKQPHPRGKLRHSPSPTLRLPRRRRAPRRLRLNRPLPQQPKRGPNTPSGTESAAEKPSPAAGNTAD